MLAGRRTSWAGVGEGVAVSQGVGLGDGGGVEVGVGLGDGGGVGMGVGLGGGGVGVGVGEGGMRVAGIVRGAGGCSKWLLAQRSAAAINAVARMGGIAQNKRCRFLEVTVKFPAVVR